MTVTARRLYAPTVLGLVAAGGTAFLLARRPWATTTLGDGQGAGTLIETSGSDITPLVPGLAVVVVAAGLALLAAGGRLRQVIGGGVVLVAVAGVLASRTDPEAAVQSALDDSVAFGEGVEVTTVAHSASILTAVAFAAAGLLGLMAVRYSAHWPAMGSRYDAPSARQETADETDLWKAMDAGVDPTDDAAGDTTDRGGPETQ